MPKEIGKNKKEPSLQRESWLFFILFQARNSLIMNKLKIRMIFPMFFLLFLFAPAFCQEINQTVPPAPAQELPRVPPEQKFVGEFFEVKVSLENYSFVKGCLMVFGNKFGASPKTPQEEEKVIWDQLLLSYEAFRRGVVINQEEVDREVDKILQAEKTSFDRKMDKAAYEKWVKDKVNASWELFENQIRHFLQIEKLRQQIMNGIEPPVTRKEAFEEFLNEHNSLDVEMIKFADKKAADSFYLAARGQQKLWDEEKNKRPNDFKRIGLVSWEFLLDIWKFPKDDLEKMLTMEKLRIHQAFPIYNGYAVCRIMETRPANKKDFERFKDYYYEQVRGRKKNNDLDLWFENLKKQAKIKIYPVPTIIKGS